MLKWTTRGSLNDSDSGQLHVSSVEKSTIQAFSSVITQLNMVSNPDHASVDSDPQPQIDHNRHGSSRRHASEVYAASTSSPPRRRAQLPGISRSSSLSRGGRDVVERQGFRHASSRSLPSSPQASQSAEDKQKKTGVLEKFKKLFRTTKSVNRVYQTNSVSVGKVSPGPARRRSRSPVKKLDTGNVKGPGSSKTRLTRLIETKREDRKQTRPNFSLHKCSIPYKSESTSSAEEHPYVQHGQLDKTLFLQKESILRYEALERTGSSFSGQRLRQNQQRHREGANINSTAVSRSARFSEFGTSLQCQSGQVVSLQRSSSLRFSIDEHNLISSEAGVFDQTNPCSFSNPQRRRWSSQSTNLALRSNYESELQPLPSVQPRSGAGMLVQLVNKPSGSDESLFQFGESLVTMLEGGSLKKVKVMPSHPDKIIQARNLLSPVYTNLPLRSPGAITPKTTEQDVKDKFLWSVTADGGMIITPTKETCRPDKIHHKQSDLAAHIGIPWPRNNNNGQLKMYGNQNVHHTDPETNATFFKICDVGEENAIHNMPIHNCVVSSEEDAIQFALKSHGQLGVTNESPVGVHVATDQKCEVSRVRVKDIVKSIEEQCEGVRKRGFPDYIQTSPVFGEVAEVGSDPCRFTDNDYASDRTTVTPPAWVTDPGQEKNSELNDTFTASFMMKRTHNYSSGESEGFSPKVCSSVSEARLSSPLTLHRLDSGCKIESPTRSEVCESPGDTRTYSSGSPQSPYTPSFPSDMVDETWTLPSDVQGIFSDGSDVDSLVQNLALTNKAATSSSRVSTDAHSQGTSDQSETDQTADERQDSKHVFEKDDFPKYESEACEREHQDSTKEFPMSPSRRDHAPSISILLSANNLEEGITDVRAPPTMVLQDASVLDETEDSNCDLLEDQMQEQSVQQQQSVSSAEIHFQAYPTQFSNAERDIPITSPLTVERDIPITSPLTQKSSALGQKSYAHPTTSELRHTEPMKSTETDSDQTGSLETQTFGQEKAETVNPTPLQDGQTRPPLPRHINEEEMQLFTATGLQQGQVGVSMSTSVQATAQNCEQLLHERIKPPTLKQHKPQNVTSPRSQIEKEEGSVHETLHQTSEESWGETSEVDAFGSSLEQTNITMNEVKVLQPTQEQNQPSQHIQSTNILSDKVDCMQSRDLLVGSLEPSGLPCRIIETSTRTNLQSSKRESLKPSSLYCENIEISKPSNLQPSKMEFLKPSDLYCVNMDTPTPTNLQSETVKSLKASNLCSGNVETTPTNLHSEKGKSLKASSLYSGNVESPTPTNLQSSKAEFLKPVGSPEGAGALMTSPRAVAEHGSRSGDDKNSLNVKPKKKVSFNLSVSQQDNVSSLSDVAVIELAPRTKATPVYKQARAKGVTDDLDRADNVSSTDVSSSFSLRSNEGQGQTLQGTSTSGEDLTWWGPDVVEDINFFHDEVNKNVVNDIAVNDKTVNDKDISDKDVNFKDVKDKEVKNAEEERSLDAAKRTVNLSLLTHQESIEHEANNFSLTSSENEDVNSEETKSPNAINKEGNGILTCLKNGAVKSPSSKSRQETSEQKSDDNKQTDSTFRLDRKSNMNVTEKRPQNLPSTVMEMHEEASKYQKGDVGSPHFGITKKDGNVHKTYSLISDHVTDSDVKSKDGNVHKTYAHVSDQVTDSDVKNKDGNVNLTDSDITNDDDNDSLSDTNSRTYDVSGTLARYMKVTDPWWEKPEVKRGINLENGASEDKQSSKLSEELNQHLPVRSAGCLSNHLWRSPPRDLAIHADDKRYDPETILSRNRSRQHFRSKSPSKKSPKTCLKQCSRHGPSRNHGDKQRDSVAYMASAHRHSSGEIEKFPGRHCVMILSPRKQQASFIEERKRFVFTKRSNKTGSEIMKGNDNTKTSCDGDKKRQFDFSSRSQDDFPVSARTSQAGYSSKTRGLCEVAAKKTQTCNRGGGKKNLSNDVSPLENATRRSSQLAEEMSPSSPRHSKHKSALSHTDCQSSSEQSWKTSEKRSSEVVSSFQQAFTHGVNSLKRLNIQDSPSQINPSKCNKSISLVEGETILTPESKRCATDNSHEAPLQTIPKSPKYLHKSRSTESINSLNCASDDNQGRDMDSKTQLKKNQKLKCKLGRDIDSLRGTKADFQFCDSHLWQDQMAQDSSSQSEDQDRHNDLENQTGQNDLQDQVRPNKSMLLKQLQQPFLDYSTCPYGTKNACRQHIESREGSSQTELDHASLHMASASQYSHMDLSHGSKSSHSNTARPGVSKFRCKRKASLNGSQLPYISQARPISSKPRYCSTDAFNKPARQSTLTDSLGASQTQFSYMGQGDGCTAPKCRFVDSQPGQWLFIATFFVFQIFLHWLYAR